MAAKPDSPTPSHFDEDFLFEDDTFVEVVPEKFSCSVCCCRVQREAHLTRCCGHHFCFKCIDRVCRDGLSCPICKEKHVEIFPNKERQREVKSLKIKCTVHCGNSTTNCEWKGQIGEYAVHVSNKHGVTVSGWLIGKKRIKKKPQVNANQPSSATLTSHGLHRPSSIANANQPSSATRASHGLHRPSPIANASQPSSATLASHGLHRPSPIATFRFRPILQPHVIPVALHHNTPPQFNTIPDVPCSHLKSPPQITEYVRLPGDRTLKVYERKDGSKFYNDHGKRKNVEACHTFVTSSSSSKASTCKLSSKDTRFSPEHVHLGGDRTLKVYERKDGSKFYNDHGRRQNIQPFHTLSTASTWPTHGTGTASASISRSSSSTCSYPQGQVHLPGGRALKIYERKDGTCYYNDHGRRKNI